MNRFLYVLLFILGALLFVASFRVFDVHFNEWRYWFLVASYILYAQINLYMSHLRCTSKENDILFTVTIRRDGEDER